MVEVVFFFGYGFVDCWLLGLERGWDVLLCVGMVELGLCWYVWGIELGLIYCCVWWIGGGFFWSIVVFGWVLMFGIWLVGSGRDVLVFWLRCCVLVFLWLLGFGLIWRLLCILQVWLLRKCKKRNKNIDFCNFLGNELFEEEHEPFWGSEEEHEQLWKNTKKITKRWSSKKIIKRKNNDEATNYRFKMGNLCFCR